MVTLNGNWHVLLFPISREHVGDSDLCRVRAEDISEKSIQAMGYGMVCLKDSKKIQKRIPDRTIRKFPLNDKSWWPCCYSASSLERLS